MWSALRGPKGWTWRTHGWGVSEELGCESGYGGTPGPRTLWTSRPSPNIPYLLEELRGVPWFWLIFHQTQKEKQLLKTSARDSPPTAQISASSDSSFPDGDPGWHPARRVPEVNRGYEQSSVSRRPSRSPGGSEARGAIWGLGRSCGRGAEAGSSPSTCWHLETEFHFRQQRFTRGGLCRVPHTSTTENYPEGWEERSYPWRKDSPSSLSCLWSTRPSSPTPTSQQAWQDLCEAWLLRGGRDAGWRGSSVPPNDTLSHLSFVQRHLWTLFQAQLFPLLWRYRNNKIQTQNKQIYKQAHTETAETYCFQSLSKFQLILH